MIDYQKLCVACSQNDDQAAAEGMPSILESLGVSMEGMRKAAIQRAMRGVSLLLRKKPLKPFEVFEPTEKELPIYSAMLAVWVDGLAAGVRAKMNEDKQ
jgi:hypothetical protein